MWRVRALDRDGREIAFGQVATGELTIGRDGDRHLILPSASVSRRHARLYVEDGRLLIADEGSSNGVLVDGVRISAPTVVGPLTRIEVAEFRLAIEALANHGVVAPGYDSPPPNHPVGEVEEA